MHTLNRMIPPFRLLPICILLLISKNGYAQPEFIKKLFSNRADSTRKSSFVALPVIGYAQETGLEFGAVGLYSFYTDLSDTLTRNSSIRGVATFTTEKQSNFQLKADIWKPQNLFHYVAELRYRNALFNFYGIGSNTARADEDVLTQKLIRILGSVEKKFGAVFYVGINLRFESYVFGDQAGGGIYENKLTPVSGRGGGNVLLAGISQTLDSRNTNTYTQSGGYLNAGYFYAPDVFGGTNFKGGSIRGDARFFKSLGSSYVLGLQGIYQSIGGNSARPFYLLPQLGSDEIMRGYYTGRYRDKNLTALQAELRFRLSPRIGAVGFAGTGTVFGTEGISARDLKPNYGAGLRYFFDVARSLSIRMDYGFGEKRTGEKRQQGFYLALGEAF